MSVRIAVQFSSQKKAIAVSFVLTAQFPVLPCSKVQILVVSHKIESITAPWREIKWQIVDVK
jgi:hypothetical protein